MMEYVKLSQRIREALEGSGSKFSLAQQRRLRALIDAAETTEALGDTSDAYLLARVTLLRADISDEFQAIQKAATK